MIRAGTGSESAPETLTPEELELNAAIEAVVNSPSLKKLVIAAETVYCKAFQHNAFRGTARPLGKKSSMRAEDDLTCVTRCAVR